MSELVRTVRWSCQGQRVRKSYLKYCCRVWSYSLVQPDIWSCKVFFCDCNSFIFLVLGQNWSTISVAVGRSDWLSAVIWSMRWHIFEDRWVFVWSSFWMKLDVPVRSRCQIWPFLGKFIRVAASKNVSPKWNFYLGYPLHHPYLDKFIFSII